MHTERFEKIIETLECIASWDEEKLKNVIVEMEETLIHNYNMLREDNSTKLFFNEFLKYNK